MNQFRFTITTSGCPDFVVYFIFETKEDITESEINQFTEAYKKNNEIVDTNEFLKALENKFNGKFKASYFNPHFEITI